MCHMPRWLQQQLSLRVLNAIYRADVDADVDVDAIAVADEASTFFEFAAV